MIEIVRDARGYDCTGDAAARSGRSPVEGSIAIAFVHQCLAWVARAAGAGRLAAH